MLPDFEMIVHKLPDNRDITIIPVYDVHLGAAEHMEQAFREFINKVTETPNVYLVLGGDLINNNIRSACGDIFKETRSPSAQKKEMAKILEPCRDRILCSVTGNHERRSTRDSDDDPSYDIMAKLDLEHLHRENVCFLKIQFGDRLRENGTTKASDQRPTYSIVAMHGAGGGIYTGTSVLRAERMGYSIVGMDALIVGHSHRPFVTQPGQIVIDKANNKVSVKPFKVISATSWMEWGGYAAQKMLLPTTHCVQTLTLCGDHKEMVVRM